MSKKLPLILFLITLILTENGIVYGQTSNYKAILKSEFILSPKDSLWRTHVSNPVKTETGLLVAFRALTNNSDFGVWLCSNENGIWSTPKEVVPPKGVDNEKIIYVMPVLQNWPDGSVKLFYKELITKERKRFGMFKTSFDGGKTWSKGERFHEGIFGPVKNKPRFLENGTIISPSQTAFIKPENNGQGRFNFHIHFEKSVDGGKTWTKIIPPINEKVEKVNTLEPCILVHPNNTLQALCRTSMGRIIETWSYDNGESWSPLIATSLPNSNAGFDALRLKDGRYLLAYNHSSDEGDRSTLNVALSKDGINWEAALLVENDEKRIEEFAYPSIIQTEDSLVHMTYSWNLMNIKHVVIDVKNLKAAPIIDGIWPKEIN